MSQTTTPQTTAAKLRATVTSKTDEYRAKISDRIVDDMLEAVEKATKYGTWLLYLIMAATFIHVTVYLWTNGLSFNGPLIVASIDGCMIILFHVFTVKGMNVIAKTAALAGAAFAGYLSVKLNYIAAEGNPLAQDLYPKIVGLAIFVKLVVSLMEPSVKAMAKYEAKAAPAVPTTPERTAEEQAAIDARTARMVATKAQRKAERELAAKIAAEQAKPTTPKAPRQRRTAKPQTGTVHETPAIQVPGLVIAKSMEDIAELLPAA